MSIKVAIKKSFPNMFRPMKWMHFDLPTDYGRGEWFAHGVRGTFHVYDSREKFPNEKPYYAKNISEMFDTLEQAQMACQARNEGDILIGLSPEFISEIDRLQRENDELRPYKDELLRLAEAVGEKDDPFAAWEHLEPAIARAEAAEAEVTRLQTELALSKPLYSRRQIEARVKLLEEALKPFAEYMGDHLDKDNHGNPLPDDLGVGWIYLNHADFRRARNALASTGGDHHAE